MWLPLLKQLILIYPFVLSVCYAAPSFYIIIPRSIISNEDTRLAVHWFGNYSEVLVTATLRPAHDRADVLVKSEIFYNDTVGILTLPALTGNISSEYYLTVEGYQENGTIFSSEYMLETIWRDISLYIQTNKITYRPGDTVKLRVVAVDHELQPYNGLINVNVMDPDENIIHQWAKRKLNLGVVTLEMVLAKYSMTGSWKIQAVTQDFSSIEYFVVDEGVLPKFDVTLKAPFVYIDSKKTDISGIVTAKYPSGKPVAGTVSIFVTPTYIYGNSYKVNKTFEISGSVNFNFNYTELVNVMMWGSANITATVTEELTGIKLNATSQITRSYYEYTFILKDRYGQFIPDTNYTAKMKIMRVDQQPLSTEEKGSNISLKITQFSNYWWWYSSINSVVQRYTKPLDDFLAIKFEVLPTTQMMTMEAEYRNTTQTWYLYKSYGMNYIEISDISSPVQVGTPFQVQTEVYPEVEELFYVVMAKGVVVSAGRQKRTAFSLTPEQSWAPCANIILFCHAVDSYVNILQISSVLHVKGMFKNKVSLSWSKSKAQPSEQVSLLINVNESNSLVGLQVTDKQASFRRDDKDFTASKVEKSFMSYTQPWDFYTVTDAATSMYYFSAEDVDPTPSGIPGLNPTASSIQGSPTNVEAQFAEPWIWLDTNLSSRNTFSLPLSVPDTMTSWLANAFVISDKHGLGFTEEPVEFQVFQNVSITVNLPYSVIRGELFLLEVVLCNHLRENLKVKVSLEKNMLFDMGELNNGSAEAQQTLDVPSKEEKLFLFPVKPQKVGTIPITVKAVSNTTSNTVTRNIVVKAEGLRKTYSQSTLFDLTTLGPNLPLSKTLSFTFPPDVVEGSEEAYINIIGNLLVPSLNGLESLIEMPCGCGEQNMIYLAPDIYVMQYLEATNQVTENIRKSAVEKMRQGYQNELIYRRNDSSFSAFGMYDTSGSTWLSAFVLRCFLQARPYIYINPDVLNQTVNWLLQYQDIRTGIFSEPGRVIHYSLQGGLNGPITLTAYILTSLLEDVHYARLYESRIHKAVQYLEEQFQKGIASNYTLSVVAYALLLANSTKGAAALDQLNSRATVSGSSKYWSAPLEKVAYYWQPMTADIETAAYALLSFHHQSRVADGIPVMKWLSQQRNHLGGFISTQDTVMALQALSKFSLLTHSNETSLTMSVTGPGTSKPKVFKINSENIMLLQSTEIEVSQPLSVNVTAVGRGLAIAQLNILYNLKTSSRHRSAAASEAFSLDVKVEEDKVYTDRLSTEICTSYLGKWNQTGMVILEVGYVSGFVMSLEGIPINGSVKKVETNTEKMFIYLDSVTANQTCLHIPMERDFKVASSKDALIRIYDYYNPSDFASRTYNTVPKDICELCGTNCDFCTVSKTLEAYNSAASPAYSLFWCCIALLIYIFPYISFPF